MNNSKVRKEYLDMLNVTAACAVVFLHANACFWDYSLDSWWLSANLIESLCYFAVPVFFMISAVVSIDYPARCSTPAFLKKRVIRILLPFLIWSLIGLIFKILIGAVNLTDLTPADIVKGIFSFRFMQIYWFLPSIFCLYLSIPLFAAVPDEKKKDLFTYLALIGFILNAAVPFLKTISGTSFKWPFTIAAAADALLYIPIAYLIDRVPLKMKHAAWIYTGAVLSLLIHFGGTWFLSASANETSSVLKGYYTLPAVLYSSGIFLFFRRNETRLLGSPLKKLTDFLRNDTFSLYLVHYYVLHILRAVLYKRLLGIPDTSLLYRLSAPLITIPLSVLFIRLFRKLPKGKLLLP